MRMWVGVSPEEMCRNHLLGEHREHHTLTGTLRAGNSISGYLSDPTVLEPHGVAAFIQEFDADCKRFPEVWMMGDADA